jgi:peptidyl-prolyl cis-trans isomerase D
MLQSIRDNAQGWLAWIIVIIIIIPFALWGIQEYLHPTPKRVVAEVNGVEIPEADFQQQVRQREHQLRAMLKNQNIDLSFMKSQIRESTLAQMIEEELLVQTAIDAGMRVSDELLQQRIRQIPGFQEENGTFSPMLYENALKSQGISPGGFEREMRRSMLTDQLREGILRSALLTTDDQQQRQRLEAQQRYVSYLIIPTTRFQKTVVIGDTEIENDYKKNSARYMTAEKVSIEYVELSKENLIKPQKLDENTLKQRYQERKATFTTPAQWKARHILFAVSQSAQPEAINAAKNKAQQVLAQIHAGKAFEELAKTFSDDAGSKNQGGDLGWFGTGAMVKPFEEAVKTMKVGEVSEPIQSEFGFHIIKLEDSKPEVTRSFAEVKQQLAEELQKEAAESAFYGQAEQFANLAFEHPNSLDVLAETLKLPIKTTELFEHTISPETDSILSHQAVIDAAFSDAVLKEGYNSEVIDIDEQDIVVLRLKDHQPAQPKPLAEVKAEITTNLTREKAKAEVQTLGKDLLNQIKAQANPDQLASKHDLQWLPAQWIQRHDSTLKQPDIVREAFKMGHPSKNQAIYQGITLSNGDYALIALLDVKAGKITIAKTDKTKATDQSTTEKSTQQQQQALGESEYQQLVSELKSNAKIKNYSQQLATVENQL